MSSLSDQHDNYQRIARAISYLRSHQLAQPSLSDLAQEMSLSEFHIQRLFSEWTGLSPKQFLQFLTKEHAKSLLRDESVSQAAYGSGLSTSSRLHDLMIRFESMSPGEYKRQGEGLSIELGIHPSPFGLCFVATTERGICKLAFFDAQEEEAYFLQEIQNEWPYAQLTRNQDASRLLIEKIFVKDSATTKPLKLLLKGSEFQVKVWEALLRIPEGRVLSYQQLATSIERPSATRAVASAVARNSIAYLIPCHRVIRGSGEFNQYRWGEDRKIALIANETRSKES